VASAIGTRTGQTIDSLSGRLKSAATLCLLFIQLLSQLTSLQPETQPTLSDWLRAEYGIEKPSNKLLAATELDSDTWVGEVKRIRGKKLPLTAARGDWAGVRPASGAAGSDSPSTLKPSEIPLTKKEAWRMRKAEAMGRFGSVASAEGYALPMGALSEYCPPKRVTH
jgi:hypothetical protein